MKKSIYFSGILCTILILIGCIFKTLRWPVADNLIALSVFLFCFYFLPAALFQGYKSQETLKYRSLYIVTYIVFFIFMMTILFRVLHWPGVAVIMSIGLPLPFVLFLPAYLYYTHTEKKEDNTNFLGLMFGMIFLAVFSVLLVFGVSKFVLRNEITRLYSIEKTRTFEEQVLTQYKTENDIRNSADDLCAFIEKIKDKLLEETQANNHSDIKVLTKYHWEMVNTNDKAIPTDILFNSLENSNFEQLKEKVNNYHTSLLATKKMSAELTELTNELFNVGVDWEQREFSNKQAVFVLGALSQIQSNVRLVELEYLASLK